MEQTKRARLESRNWKVGSAADFLALTPAEETFIEMKLSLCQSLKNMRQSKRISQVNLAKLIQSSQSRVAKMESGAESVSIDLIMKSLLALGASKKDLAAAIKSQPQNVLHIK